jgi:hypothetical protein
MQLDEGSPTRAIDACDPTLDGDVSGQLRPVATS